MINGNLFQFKINQKHSVSIWWL